MKDVVVEGPAPLMMIGVVVCAQLDALEVNDQGDHFLGYGEQHACTHKSCLWNLPYFDAFYFPIN